MLEGMILLGLTGGIGSGKSTVARMMNKQAGFPVIDADAIAREIVDPGQPALDDIAAEFGADVLNPDGSLNRALLASRAFAEQSATEKLNAIMHPRIMEESRRRIQAERARGTFAVIYDMPLLVELGLHRLMDRTVVVDVPAEVRVQRLVTHRGLTEADARRRIAAQANDAERREAADILLDNSGSLEKLAEEVSSLVTRLKTA